MSPVIRRYETVWFYGFAFGIAWAAWFLMSRVYTGGEPGPLVYVLSTLGGVGPLLALVLVDRLSHQAVSVRAILSEIQIRRAKAAWFVPAIFAWPLITLTGNVGYVLLGQEKTLRLIKAGPDSLGAGVVLVMAVHFAASLITSPLFEEPGWRGFALGRLQARWGRDLGSLGVGLLWWLWHQPMNLTFGLQPSVYSALSMVALSFMIDSLYNLSGRNLFTAMLAHQSSGTVIAFLYQGTDNVLQLGLLIGLVVALRVVEHVRARPLSPAPQ